MENMHLQTIILLLTFSVFVVTLLRRFNFSPIVGFLFVGVIVGPHALAWLPDDEALRSLAEIGVVFLLFTIGLEFSITRLLAMRDIVLKLGTSQVLITTFCGGIIAWYIGMTWQAALVVGGILTLSSTALVIKQLTEQQETHAKHTQVAIGILLFQDVAVAPFLVIIPFLASSTDASIVYSLLIALAKGVFAFALMYSLGHWGLRPVLRFVASMRSSELFTLTVILVALTAATLTHSLGLSLTLGAFLAGMMLGETEFRHQIEVEIRPFRDILMSLFFISIGTQLNIALLPDIWISVCLFVLVLIAAKGLIIVLLVKSSGYDSSVALRSGVVLSQGGEFSLVLLALAMEYKLFQVNDSQIVLTIIILSLAIAPILIRYNENIARFFLPQYFKRRLTDKSNNVTEASAELTDHVILCGYGRAGQNVAHFLRSFNIEYVAFDLDPHLIKEAWEGGERAFYLDSTRGDSLRAAGIEKARAIVITFDHLDAARCIIALARDFNPDIKIIVRTPHDLFMEQLKNSGADIVVPDNMESSLVLSTNLLRSLDVPRHEITILVDKIRDNQYKALRGMFHGRDSDDSEICQHNLHTVLLNSKSYAIDKDLYSLGLEKDGITIRALFRNGRRIEDLRDIVKLISGDALILEGCSDSLLLAEKFLLRGKR